MTQHDSNTIQLSIQIVEGGVTALGLVEVSVLDVNEAPSISSMTFTIPETAEDLDLVGTIVSRIYPIDRK